MLSRNSTKCVKVILVCASAQWKQQWKSETQTILCFCYKQLIATTAINLATACARLLAKCCVPKTRRAVQASISSRSCALTVQCYGLPKGLQIRFHR